MLLIVRSEMNGDDITCCVPPALFPHYSGISFDCITVRDDRRYSHIQGKAAAVIDDVMDGGGWLLVRLAPEVRWAVGRGAGG